MSRRVLLLVVAGIAVVVAVTAFQVLGNPGDSTGDNPGGNQPVAAPEQPRSPSAAELEQISAAVTSGVPDRIREVFAVPAGQELRPAFLTELRGWKQLRLDAGTYTALEDGVGTVEGTLVPATAASSRWLLTVQLLDGAWRVLSTEPVTS